MSTTVLFSVPYCVTNQPQNLDNEATYCYHSLVWGLLGSTTFTCVSCNLVRFDRDYIHLEGSPGLQNSRLLIHSPGRWYCTLGRTFMWNIFMDLEISEHGTGLLRQTDPRLEVLVGSTREPSYKLSWTRACSASLLWYTYTIGQSRYSARSFQRKKKKTSPCWDRWQIVLHMRNESLGKISATEI